MFAVTELAERRDRASGRFNIPSFPYCSSLTCSIQSICVICANLQTFFAMQKNQVSRRGCAGDTVRTIRLVRWRNEQSIYAKYSFGGRSDRARFTFL
jgi:hypothetical protein